MQSMQSKLPLPVFWQSSGLDLYKFLGFNEIDSLDRNENLMKHLEDLGTSEPSNPTRLTSTFWDSHHSRNDHASA